MTFKPGDHVRITAVNGKSLRKAIDALRKKGWGVEVKVTEPPSEPKTYTL